MCFISISELDSRVRHTADDLFVFEKIFDSAIYKRKKVLYNT